MTLLHIIAVLGTSVMGFSLGLILTRTKTVSRSYDNNSWE